MKKICFLSTTMLFVMAILLPLNLNMLNAQTFYQVCSTGQCLRYTITNGTEVDVVGAGCMTDDLVIPSTVSYNGITYSVTSIGDGAFAGYSGLTSITIPNSVTSISGNFTFYGCSSLTSITIPNSVTSIGNYTFEGCSSLTSITIPNSVTSIGNYTFEGCSSLTSITIPNSVTSIGNFTFDGCSSLTSITIPNSVTSIGYGAFYGCSGLTSITIPNSVTSIDDRAFYGCSGLTSITVDANNTVYDSRDNCNAIIRTGYNTLIVGCQNTTIPNSVTSIGGSAFIGCSSLTSITIPNSVTSIGDYTFYGCSGLTSITVDVNNTVLDSRDNCNAIIRTSNNTLIVGCQNTTIPNSVTSIGGSAFYGCSGLTSITIPNSVTSIGGSAFYGCSGLNSISIPNSVTYIGNRAFYGCSGLTSISIPNSVTSIGDRAFYGCSGLTSISIPNSVTSFGDYTFYGCSSLTSITVPNSVTSIGDYTFSGCSGLTSISIPNSVTSIGNFTFDGCSGLTSITIPNSVTSIGGRAFIGCSSLTSITVPNSVTSIGDYTFSDCSGLISITVDVNNTVYDSRDNCNAIIRTSDNTLIVGCQNTTIPNSVTSIGYGAFSRCSGLTSITIPNSVTSIVDYTFYGCSGLTSISIPNSVTFIGYGAFYGCSGLTSISIPNSVTSIGGGAFSGCSGLTSITIPNSVTSIGGGAFSGCSGLTSITIPNSVTSIGSGSFYGCSGLTSINVDANNPVYDSRDNCNAIIRTNDNTLQTACKNTIIPATVTSIGNNAFYGQVGSDTIICLATTPPVLEGCICDFFGDVPDDFRIIIPCGTMPNYNAAWSDSPYLLESGSGPGYDTSITVVCPDSCYIWNGESYCQSGDYTQTLQTVHGCDSVVTLHLTITVGIDDQNLGASMTVHPNPTNSVVNVQCTMNNVQVETVEIWLYDAYGKLVNVAATNNEGIAQIDLSRYAPGIYLIKAVADGNVVAVRKVVKR